MVGEHGDGDIKRRQYQVQPSTDVSEISYHDDDDVVSEQDKKRRGPAYDHSPWIPIIKTSTLGDNDPAASSPDIEKKTFSSQHNNLISYQTNHQKLSTRTHRPKPLNQRYRSKPRPRYPSKIRRKLRTTTRLPVIRRAKRLRNSPHRSHARRNDKIDLKTKAKHSSVLALSIIASLLAF